MESLKITSKSTVRDAEHHISSECDVPVSVAFRVSLIDDYDSVLKVDTQASVDKCEAGMNIEQWERETALLSANNYNNSHFEAIVKMGAAAVPAIYSILQERPTPLVHALELIYPEKVYYKGFISLKQARKIWLKILTTQIFV